MSSEQSASELDAVKRRMREMEEEAAKLREMQAQVERDILSTMAPARSSASNTASAPTGPLEPAEVVDARSVYVGNVDYGASPEELQAHFAACGAINRITILCDKWTGHPKGFAYIEFADPAAVSNALALHESTFRERVLKVMAKRGNVPGMSAASMHRGRGRGRARVYRGGRRGSYAPY